MKLPLQRRNWTSVGASLALSLPAAASDLFVGGGGSFATIDAAIAAAQPGDRIFVGPGQFPGFHLNKPLEIRGAGVGLTRIGHFETPARTTVSGIPAGATATLTAMSFDPAWFLTLEFGAQVTVSDNAGTVVLQDIRTNTQPTAQHIGSGVSASNTARLVIQHSTIQGLSSAGFGSSGQAALVAIASTLEVADSTLVAAADSTGDPFFPGAAGALLQGCAARFARVVCTGGPGGSPGGSGVELSGSSLVLAGGPGNQLRGGASGAEGGAGLRVLAGSSALVASDVVLLGGSGAPPGSTLALDGTSTATVLDHRLPVLAPAPQQVAVGNGYTLNHAGQPGAAVITALGTGLGPALLLPGVTGTLHLDLLQSVLLPTLVLDGSGLGATPGTVPVVPALQGAHAWFQSAMVLGSTVHLSNPARLALAL